MTPMVDVVFQLMTFMLFSVQMTGGEKVDVPPARHGVGVEESAATFLTLLKPDAARGRAAGSCWATARGRPRRSTRPARPSPTGVREGRRKVVLQADGARPARRGPQGRRRRHRGRGRHAPHRRPGAGRVRSADSTRRGRRHDDVGDLGCLPQRSAGGRARPEHRGRPRGAGAGRPPRRRPDPPRRHHRRLGAAGRLPALAETPGRARAEPAPTRRTTRPRPRRDWRRRRRRRRRLDDETRRSPTPSAADLDLDRGLGDEAGPTTAST